VHYFYIFICTVFWGVHLISKFQCRAEQPVPPSRFRFYVVGPSAITGKFPPCTEYCKSRQKQWRAKLPPLTWQHLYILWGTPKDFPVLSENHPKNHLADGPTHQQTSHVSSAATLSQPHPKPNGVNELHKVCKPNRKTVVPNCTDFIRIY